jgi:hypothetical protein
LSQEFEASQGNVAKKKKKDSISMSFYNTKTCCIIPPLEKKEHIREENRF